MKESEFKKFYNLITEVFIPKLFDTFIDNSIKIKPKKLKISKNNLEVQK